MKKSELKALIKECLLESELDKPVGVRVKKLSELIKKDILSGNSGWVDLDYPKYVHKRVLELNGETDDFSMIYSLVMSMVDTSQYRDRHLKNRQHTNS